MSGILDSFPLNASSTLPITEATYGCPVPHTRKNPCSEGIRSRARTLFGEPCRLVQACLFPLFTNSLSLPLRYVCLALKLSGSKSLENGRWVCPTRGRLMIERSGCQRSGQDLLKCPIAFYINSALSLVTSPYGSCLLLHLVLFSVLQAKLSFLTLPSVDTVLAASGLFS